MSAESTPLRGHQAPLDYHRRLLDDPHRMDAFERALRARVRPGDVVLDAGAGTGILAMLAARLGAARVHAVEIMPVARLARELVRANGLEDRVIVHEQDLVSMAPVEPVDLVVSEFLGAFLVDDAMLDAVEAAARWLKPGGRFLPEKVTLRLAPVGGFGFPAIDTAGGDQYGLSFAPMVQHVLNHGYRCELSPDHLLAPAAEYVVYRPARPCTFDGELGFTVEKPERLRGLAGWFDAELTESIALSSAPGIETHWGQTLFPVPAMPVERGDRVELRLRLLEGPPVEWEWRTVVARGGEKLLDLTLDTRERLGERAAPAPPAPMPDGDDQRAEAAMALNERGGAAHRAGNNDELLASWREAARLLPPRHAFAAPLYENLGIGYLFARRFSDAARAFLRALDGNLTSREQSLRLLVYALHDSDRRVDAARMLALYEATFGRHPSRDG